MKAAVLKKVTARLVAGSSINSFTTAGTSGYLVKRAWSSITSERTRIKSEELAEAISMISDEGLRDSLRLAMTTLFVSIEEDLEQETTRCRT